jgi:hypothetical protein
MVQTITALNESARLSILIYRNRFLTLAEALNGETKKMGFLFVQGS